MNCEERRQVCHKDLKDYFAEKFIAQDALHKVDQVNTQAAYESLIVTFDTLRDTLWEEESLKTLIDERNKLCMAGEDFVKKVKNANKLSLPTILSIGGSIIVVVVGALWGFHLYMDKINQRIVINEQTNKQILRSVEQIEKKLAEWEM